MLSKLSWRHALLSGIALIAIVLVFLQPPIPQSPGYHAFADDRCLLGIPNFWNVVSNLPFILAGVLGIAFLHRPGSLLVQKGSAPDSSSLAFFLGILLTAFGSVWYHLHPDNHTMLWDRLPMTITFMAFFSIVIRDCIAERLGSMLLLPLLLTGLLSVAWWHYTEGQGRGDLRFYFLVQFLPMLLIPLILLLFKSTACPKVYLWLVVLAYGIAKLLEILDVEVFRVAGISGHSIKHVMAAMAPLIYFLGLRQRRNLRRDRRVEVA